MKNVNPEVLDWCFQQQTTAAVAIFYILKMVQARFFCLGLLSISSSLLLLICSFDNTHRISDLQSAHTSLSLDMCCPAITDRIIFSETLFFVSSFLSLWGNEPWMFVFSLKDRGSNWKHIICAKPFRCILKLIIATQVLAFLLTCLIKTVRLPASSSAGHFLTLQMDPSFTSSPSVLCVGCLMLSTRLPLFDLQPSAF